MPAKEERRLRLLSRVADGTFAEKASVMAPYNGIAHIALGANAGFPALAVCERRPQLPPSSRMPPADPIGLDQSIKR
ncbi:hypothetical protein ABIB82_007271 [Bradyrhizobium sp. i1.8.4]|uniref:hypothetical protein n=1 Tax=unclassified Bradyrhizobium TaxID=2631580 RepID=UPI003D231D84